MHSSGITSAVDHINPSAETFELTLIADVGATNGRFAMVKPSGEISNIVFLACADHENFDQAVEKYLSGLGTFNKKPQKAIIAVASPVLGDKIKLTNNHWHFSIDEVRQQFGWEHFKVINDFSAISYALPHLKPNDVEHIGGHQKEDNATLPMATLGPGTGLGMGGLIPNGNGGWTPIVTEGGHITMPAMTDEEEKILRVLRHKFDHASAERVLSGAGLVNLYLAFCTIDDVIPADVQPPDVSHRALSNRCPQSKKAVKMFAEMLGTVAADLALTMGAIGGVYIAGGIVKRMGKAFDNKAFRHRFETKGRFGSYLTPIPTYKITSRHISFLGLRHLAEIV